MRDSELGSQLLARLCFMIICRVKERVDFVDGRRQVFALTQDLAAIDTVQDVIILI